ncbi:protection of telomeres protein 1 isoform X1 [Xyrichtys novacula]|uniref:Protection of telomeres protein 1 n=1 Tax=Xyrichtys novacula TaxID=13765 RepID=A0AAV1F4B0_XYRNO|nr:protection of telomeres protein 1 isoform X1 [Xyrichtys novacula]
MKSTGFISGEQVHESVDTDLSIRIIAVRVTSAREKQTSSTSSGQLDNMPVHVLSEGAGPGTQVPNDLTRIPTSDINPIINPSNKAVQGKVVRKGPLVLAADNFILKAVIQEEESQTDTSAQSASINVVLMGTLAKEFNLSVKQGDVLMVSGFTVGKSPTANKDKLHPWNLQLSGDKACVYVFSQPTPPDPRSQPAVKRNAALSSQVSRATKSPKYTYVRLDDLKAESVVNVYGVVTFFKQPYKSRGTDFCSVLKITDQSNEEILCKIFCKKLEDHPKVLQVGDIVRLHGVKFHYFRDSKELLKTFGFSALTFDGVVGNPVEPRTSSQSVHFDEEDRRRVEELRSWYSAKSVLPAVSTTPLSAVTPKVYFDLTCQLLAKTFIDNTRTLLSVWDGTRCSYPLAKVKLDPDVTEGPSSFCEEKESLIANILVYDNHSVFARQLKPGNFLRIYNLHAVPGSITGPGIISDHREKEEHLVLYLHGGATYGRGMQILPEDSSDVRELKRNIAAFQMDTSMSDSEMIDVWCTPPESTVSSERRCDHDVQPKTLFQLKQSKPSGVHHVRVQLRSYEPFRLYQALKLYCSKCKTIREIPDEETIADVFSKAARSTQPHSPLPFLVSERRSFWKCLSEYFFEAHILTYFVPQRLRELIFLRGLTLEEMCSMASCYHNVIPVRSSRGDMALLDLFVPFLFRGRRRYYGCDKCSEVRVTDPCLEDIEPIDEKIIAKGLGVQLMQFVLLMKFELQDATDSLDVFLWRDAELFFGVSAEFAAVGQEAQDRIGQIMDFLCPPESNPGERPWLDLCLRAYQSESNGGRSQTCFEICQTTFTGRPSTD